MEPPRPYFVRIAGQVRGPIGVEQLREMGTIDVVTPETEIASSAEGPWVRLATLAICPEVFPARRAIAFKAAQFEAISLGAAPPMDPQQAIEQALHSPAALRGRELFVPPHLARRQLDSDPLNDVQEMVLEVGRRVAANAPEVVLPLPPSRLPRWPWFAALSVVGSIAIMCIPFLYDRKYDVMSTSILGCWTVMFNGLLIAVLLIDRRIDAHVRLSKSKMNALQ
jgi:hypothetical protein